MVSVSRISTEIVLLTRVASRGATELLAGLRKALRVAGGSAARLNARTYLFLILIRTKEKTQDGTAPQKQNLQK